MWKRLIIAAWLFLVPAISQAQPTEWKPPPEEGFGFEWGTGGTSGGSPGGTGDNLIFFYYGGSRVIPDTTTFRSGKQSYRIDPDSDTKSLLSFKACDRTHLNRKASKARCSTRAPIAWVYRTQQNTTYSLGGHAFTFHIKWPAAGATGGFKFRPFLVYGGISNPNTPTFQGNRLEFVVVDDGGTCTASVCSAGAVGEACSTNADCTSAHNEVHAYVNNTPLPTPTVGPHSICSTYASSWNTFHWFADQFKILDVAQVSTTGPDAIRVMQMTYNADVGGVVVPEAAGAIMDCQFYGWSSEMPAAIINWYEPATANWTGFNIDDFDTDLQVNTTQNLTPVDMEWQWSTRHFWLYNNTSASTVGGADPINFPQYGTYGALGALPDPLHNWGCNFSSAACSAGIQYFTGVSAIPPDGLGSSGTNWFETSQGIVGSPSNAAHLESWVSAYNDDSVAGPVPPNNVGEMAAIVMQGFMAGSTSLGTSDTKIGFYDQYSETPAGLGLGLGNGSPFTSDGLTELISDRNQPLFYQYYLTELDLYNKSQPMWAKGVFATGAEHLIWRRSLEPLVVREIATANSNQTSFAQEIGVEPIYRSANFRSNTPTVTKTPTLTPTVTNTVPQSPTRTRTHTRTPTHTPLATSTFTETYTPTITPVPTNTATPNSTSTVTPTFPTPKHIPFVYPERICRRGPAQVCSKDAEGSSQKLMYLARKIKEAQKKIKIYFDTDFGGPTPGPGTPTPGPKIKDLQLIDGSDVECQDGRYIECEGPGTCILCAPDQTNLCRNTTFTGCTIDCSAVTAEPCINLDKFPSILFRENKIIGGGAFSQVKAGAVDGAKISENEMYPITGDAVNLRGQGKNNVIEKNRIELMTPTPTNTP